MIFRIVSVVLAGVSVVVSVVSVEDSVVVSVVSLMFLSSFRQVSILSGLLFSWSYWYFRGLLWQAYVILKTLNVITLRLQHGQYFARVREGTSSCKGVDWQHGVKCKYIPPVHIPYDICLSPIGH